MSLKLIYSLNGVFFFSIQLNASTNILDWIEIFKEF